MGGAGGVGVGRGVARVEGGLVVVAKVGAEREVVRVVDAVGLAG